jgi:hypothetical protein
MLRILVFFELTRAHELGSGWRQSAAGGMQQLTEAC